MSAAAEGEPGTLLHARVGTPDGCLVHAIEAYRDASAACTHLEAFGLNFATRFLALVRRGDCFLYGSATPALLDMLAPLRPLWLPNSVSFASRLGVLPN
jgi:hypothetical protein